MSFPPPSVQESFCGIWNHDDDSGATFSRAGKVLQFSPALSTRLAAVLKHAIKKITRLRGDENDDVSNSSCMSRSHTVSPCLPCDKVSRVMTFYFGFRLLLPSYNNYYHVCTAQTLISKCNLHILFSKG